MPKESILEVMGHRIKHKNVTNPALKRVISECANRNEFIFFGAKNDRSANDQHTEHHDYSERRYSDYTVYDDYRHTDYSDHSAHFKYANGP